MAISSIYLAKLEMLKNNEEYKKKMEEKGWPKGVLWFSLDDNVLGLDASDNLYVNGEAVATVSELRLSKAQTAAIVVAAVATAIISAVELARFFGFGVIG